MHDNNLEKSIRILKRKLQREGVFRELKLRRHHEKPCLKKLRLRTQSVRRVRKLLRKRLEKLGY